MFESILVKNQRITDPDNILDLGMLAEMLLFYQSVTILANRGILKQLLCEIGPETLIELIEGEHLNIIYLDNTLGIKTENTNTAHERHSPVVLSVEGHAGYRTVRTLFDELIPSPGKARRGANRFFKGIKTDEYEAGICKEITTDFSDSNVVERSIIQTIKHYAPEYPNIENINFAIDNDNDSLVVETNINFPQLNKIYQTRVPTSHSSLSPASLLSHLFTLRGDINFTAKFQSEIATDPLTSKLMHLNYEELIQQRIHSEEELHLFQDFVFDDIKAIAQAINSKRRTFEDLLKVLEKSKKFKVWLKDQKPDKKLIKEYHRAVTEGSWVDDLPVKQIRWSMFTGFGIVLDALAPSGVATAVGLASGLANSFLLDKIIKGWQPNQFVNSELREFVKSN